jgi:hypothetical protein
MGLLMVRSKLSQVSEVRVNKGDGEQVGQIIRYLRQTNRA